MFQFKTREATQRLIYKTVNGLELPMDIYLPETPIDADTPCIVTIHGGGWSRGGILNSSEWDGGMMKYHTRYFAENGYIGIAVTYRALSENNGLTVYDLIEDCTDAMQYIKNSLSYVNYKKIIVMGESAGGHLAAMLGISQNDEVRPYAVVALNPVLDCTREKWSYGFKNCDNILSASPYHQSPKKCARFVFVHGTADTIAEPEDTKEFCNRLKELGHSAELIFVDDEGHSFMLFDFKSSDEYATECTKRIYKYIADNWKL